MRALLCSLLLVGCAHGSEVLILDWQSSDEGLLLAQDAAGEWLDVCGAPVVVGRGNGGAPAWEVDGPVDAPDRGWYGLGGLSRWSKDGRPKSLVVSRTSGAERASLAHEMGHLLSRSSAHSAHGIMMVGYGPETLVTTEDCARL